MDNKLQAYMDGLFKDIVPSQKAAELKEELLQNLLEKYRDLIAEGRSEKDAYSMAIASIGDISALLDEFRGDGAERPSRLRAAFLALSSVLYVLSFVPPVLLYDENRLRGLVIMLIMMAAATGIAVFCQATRPRYRRTNDTVVEEFREWKTGRRHTRSLILSVSIAYWCVVVAVYFIFSFATRAWHITWITFLIALAIDQAIRALIKLKR